MTTPLLGAEGREVGRDARSLTLEAGAGGRAPVLVLVAGTVFHAEAGPAPAWREDLVTRFDLGLRRLSGSSVVERRDGGRTVRVRLAFRELPVPLAPVLAAR